MPICAGRYDAAGLYDVTWGLETLITWPAVAAFGLNAEATVSRSRSALGRHIHGLDALGERMRRSRQVAEALVRELGTAPESEAARLNIELMHTAILDLFMDDAEGDPDVPKKSMDIHNVAKALDHLARASKSNVEFILAAEQRATDRAKREAATVAEKVGRERGISAATIEAIKAGIFGVKAAQP
jgi:hypothetical protein